MGALPTIYCIDADGKYLGGISGFEYDDGTTEWPAQPDGTVRTTSVAPESAWDVYDEESDSWTPAHPPKLLGDRLNDIFIELPETVQAAFYMLRTGIQDAIAAGRPNIARLMIQGAPGVPAELEGVRAELLAEFDQGP